MSQKPRVRPGTAPRPDSKISGDHQQTRGDRTTEPVVIASRAYERGFIAGWCDRADYARQTRLTFDDGIEFGFQAGVQAAHRVMRNVIAEVTAGMPADAVEVVRQLVRAWEVPAVRAEADRPGPRLGDWPGREAA